MIDEQPPEISNAALRAYVPEQPVEEEGSDEN